MKKIILFLSFLSVVNTFAYKSYTDTYTPDQYTTHTITYYYSNDYIKLIKVKRCTSIITTGDIIKSCRTLKK